MTLANYISFLAELRVYTDSEKTKEGFILYNLFMYHRNSTYISYSLLCNILQNNIKHKKAMGKIPLL